MANVERRWSKSVGPILAALAVALLVYSILVALIGVAEVKAAVMSLNARTWSSVLVLSATSFFLRYVRWHWWFTRQNTGFEFFRGFIFYLAGFAFTTTPGKVGELVRLWYLGRRYRVPYSQSAPVFVFEQVVDVLAVAMLGSLVAAVVIPGASVELWGLGVLVSLVVMSIAVGRGERVYRAVLTRLANSRLRRIASVVGDLDVITGNIRALASLPMMIASVAWGILAWSAPGVGLWMVLNDLGFELKLSVAVGSFCLSLLAGALSVFSAGLGTTEAALLLLLVAAGVDAPAAAAAAIVSRVSTLWFAVGAGTLLLPAATRIARPEKV